MTEKIIPIPVLADNYVWLIQKNNAAIIVDPGETQPVLQYLKQHELQLQAIFLTHHHWDHSNGIADIIKMYPVPIYASHVSSLPYITHKMADKDLININGFNSYQIISIPGHTLDHIAFYDNAHLFCGDTLFGAGCGKAFEGSPEQLYKSLQKLLSLPESTKIYCGHEYTVKNLKFAQLVDNNNINIMQRIKKVKALRDNNLPSIPSLLSEEKATNPFLRCHDSQIIHQVELHCGQSLQSEVEVFSELRKWKNKWQ